MKISLEAARINAKLTQTEAAAKAGVSSRTIWMWENGKSYPNALQIQKLEEVYNVKYEDINFV